MTNTTRSALPMILAAVISIVIALATGADWIGRPLRAVQLLTLLGLGMTAGVAWAQAVARWRQK